MQVKHKQKTRTNFQWLPMTTTLAMMLTRCTTK